MHRYLGHETTPKSAGKFTYICRIEGIPDGVVTAKYWDAILGPLLLIDIRMIGIRAWAEILLTIMNTCYYTRRVIFIAHPV